MPRIPAEPIVDMINSRVTGWIEICTLADKAGVPADTIYRILEGRSGTIDFYMADTLLCALGTPGAWFSPELEGIYLEADLTEPPAGWRACARPDCSREFVPGDKHPDTRYCSETCREVDGRHRRGEHRNRELECRNGHKRTKDNTYIGTKGERACLTCRRQNLRDFRARKRAAMAA